MVTNASLSELAEVSARLGADPQITQGPGGNTSIKSDGRIWVKASGRWLAHAGEQQTFVPLWLDKVCERIAADESEDLRSCIVAGEVGSDLRPSIETALHALMPFPAVAHVHAVNSTTASILVGGEAWIENRLGGHVDWCWIPYRRPGAPLAYCVRDMMAGRRPEVLILQNHGIVVGAETPHDAEALLRLVENALQLPAWRTSATAASFIADLETPAYEPCFDLSDIALDPRRLSILTSGSIVPDQVAMLGGAIPVALPGEDIEAFERRIPAQAGVSRDFIAVEGVGVLGRRDRAPAADLLFRSLVGIARRVPADAETTALSRDAVLELLNWDAEHYRKSLNRGDLDV